MTNAFLSDVVSDSYAAQEEDETTVSAGTSESKKVELRTAAMNV